MSNNEQDSDETSGETLLLIYMKHPDKFIGIDEESPFFTPNKNESKPSLSKLQGLTERPPSGDANRYTSATGKVPPSKDYAVRTTCRRKENTKSAALRSLSPLSTTASTDSDVPKWLTVGSCCSAREEEKAQRRINTQVQTPSSLLMVERKANSTTTSLASSSIHEDTRRRGWNKNFQRTIPSGVSRRGLKDAATTTSGKNAKITKPDPVSKIRSTSAIEKTVYSVTPRPGARDRSDAGTTTEENKFATSDTKKDELVFLKQEQRYLRTSDSDSDECKASVVRREARKPSVRAVEVPSSKFEASVTRRRGSVNISLAAGEQCKRPTDEQVRQLSKPPWGARQPPFR